MDYSSFRCALPTVDEDHPLSLNLRPPNELPAKGFGKGFLILLDRPFLQTRCMENRFRQYHSRLCRTKPLVALITILPAIDCHGSHLLVSASHYRAGSKALCENGNKPAFGFISSFQHLRIIKTLIQLPTRTRQ